MENRIKERIRESGIMQKELAERLGMTTVGLSKIANATSIKLDTYQKVADALGVPVWKLMLSDTELDEIRSESKLLHPVDEFRCPKCGTTLKVMTSDEE